VWLKVISLSLSSFALGMAVTSRIWYTHQMKEIERRRKTRELTYKSDYSSNGSYCGDSE